MPAALYAYSGGALALSSGAPATYDSSTYAAKSWTSVVGAITAPETGDEVADVTADTLAGRTIHANGAADGGIRNLAWIYDASDSGQGIARTNNNTNTLTSVRITDADGKIEYICGLIVNLKRPERAAGTTKIETCQIKINNAAPVIV
jgi:hypothetical protein